MLTLEQLQPLVALFPELSVSFNEVEKDQHIIACWIIYASEECYFVVPNEINSIEGIKLPLLITLACLRSGLTWQQQCDVLKNFDAAYQHAQTDTETISSEPINLIP